ncbi:ATP synthase epsilon chain [Clostridia bacterium]|nr:ATP synthase epsilon chain [Clostridia bacterium]
MNQFKLKAFSPDKLFFDGEVENVIVRTSVGDKGIMANHEPYLAALPAGAVRIKSEAGWRYAAISGGSVKVAKGGETVILAHSMEWSDEIDLTRAQAARESAETRIKNAKQSADLSGDGGSGSSGNSVNYELQLAEMKLLRAVNRINSAGLK